MKTRECVRCGVVLGLKVTQPTYHSSLYGSDHQLCNICGEYEEKTIDKEGTNNIPWLLATYHKES